MSRRKSSPGRRQRGFGWLLLVHQLPPKPAYLRVKIWRRLQSLGAIVLRNSVYVLPHGEQAREDFQWLLQEIRRAGGDGLVCEAELVDGLRDDEVRALFDAARDCEYAELTKELRTMNAARKGKAKSQDLTAKLERLRQRFDTVVARDFFGATGRLSSEALFAELARQPAAPLREPVRTLAALKSKTWVTRRGVQVDRIACAWLIRRFVDPRAIFKLVDEKSYRHKKGELRFDMFEGEYTHEGERCSFEVMAELLPGADPALRAIAQIVHDVDLKDNKFGREETAGIAHVMAGICASQKRDMDRIARGGAMLDDIYERFRQRR